jgi:hypothetical protein
MSHRRLRSATLATRLRIIAWPCRNPETASLYPVPPGQSRRALFCGSCEAETCLFGGTPEERRAGAISSRWSMPDEETLSLYVRVLTLYAQLLCLRRTCWHCAHLRRLAGGGRRRYVCTYPGAEGSIARSLQPVMGRWEARLRTALEACAEEGFRRRDGPPQPLSEEFWLELRRLGVPRDRCFFCQHLRALTLNGNQRYVCHWQCAGLPQHSILRLARSRRVMLMRCSKDAWCRGELWQLREGKVPALLPLALK